MSLFSGGLQAPGGAAFPGLLSFPAGVPGFSSSTAPAALSGLHNPAVQSALLQVPNEKIGHASLLYSKSAPFGLAILLLWPYTKSFYILFSILYTGVILIFTLMFRHILHLLWKTLLHNLMASAAILQGLHFHLQLQEPPFLFSRVCTHSLAGNNRLSDAP